MTKNILLVLVGGGLAAVFLTIVLFTVPTEEVSNIDVFTVDETGEIQEDIVLEAFGEGFDTVFTCPDGSEFATRYQLGSNILQLTLSDGESYELTQARSTAGARYTTRDGSVVFFEDVGMAEITIDGEVAVSECVVED